MGLLTKSKNKTKKIKEPIAKTSQDTIPYIAAYGNGVIETSPGKFTRMYPIIDMNFKTVSQEDQDNIFLKYGDLLNLFGSEVEAEITFFNRSVKQEEIQKNILLPMAGDSLDEYREEINDILISKISEGRNNLKREKYLTVAIEAENIESANLTFQRLDSEIPTTIKLINQEECNPLTLEERLNLLNSIYNPNDIPLMSEKQIDNKQSKRLDRVEMQKQGVSTKDLIAPPVFKFNFDSFQMGETYGQVLYLQALPSYLSTDFIDELTNIPCNMLTSIHLQSLRPDKAQKLVRNQIVNINANIIDAQKKASKAGYSPDLISPDMMKSKEEADKILGDITSRNQKIMLMTMVITHFADSMDELKKQGENIIATAQKYLCTFRKLMYQQEIGFTTSLPFANNKLDIKRLLTTESASVFIPFSTLEITQKGGFYYGLNPISKNIIQFNRCNSANANGIILGTPGAGKSFIAKQEMIMALLATDADVYVIDPEREYSALATMLGGEIVRIAAGSKSYINPMDMDISYADDDDPVTLKSDFICSLCETILGGRYGLSQAQQSIIDRCVRQMYEPYLEWMRLHPEVGSRDNSKAPTLLDLYNLLNMQHEPEAQAISLALERFVKGSLDIFAHNTNVKTESRFVVYDIKDIGSGLKEMGLQVCLNDVWNKTISNRRKGKRTWFYIDEFYLLTQTHSSATFLQEIFKRARKWGGVPTGITQNVEDLLISPEARSILSNSDFVLMLKQAPNDKFELAKMFNISNEELKYITNSEAGHGLIYTGKTIVPFANKYPTDTKTYKVMSSKMEETEMGQKFAEERKKELEALLNSNKGG